jgi:DNA-binding transcriptional LysR family regulator
VWRERLPDVPLTLVHGGVAEQEQVLAGRDADAGLVRLPVDPAVFSAIPLYTETTVVVVPVDHLVAAADEVVAADLAEETLLVPGDDVLGWDDPPGEPAALPRPATTAEAVELVASGVGVLVVPQSLARLHHRRDLTYRPVTDAPTSSVGLAWVADAGSDLVDELIGIVRGRTVNSSRGRGGRGDDAEPPGRDARAPGGKGRPGGGSGGSRGRDGSGRGAGSPRRGGSRRGGGSGRGSRRPR